MRNSETFIDYDRIVDNRDIANLVATDMWIVDAEKRAKPESCGCPNCKKEAMAARLYQFYYVKCLTNKPPIDHEEQIVQSRAYTKIKNKKI